MANQRNSLLVLSKLWKSDQLTSAFHLHTSHPAMTDLKLQKLVCINFAPTPTPSLSHNSNSRVVRTSGRRINNWAGLNRRESRPQGNWFWPRRDDGTGSSNQVGLPCRRPRPRPGDTATSGACLTCNPGISKSQATQHLIVSDVFNHLLQRMFLFRRRLRGNVHLEFHECEQQFFMAFGKRNLMNLFYGISTFCCNVCRICGHQICYHFSPVCSSHC